ncbi:hypothetical protein AVEN_65466-1, partial [Araneus ventricosus]
MHRYYLNLINTVDILTLEFESAVKPGKSDPTQ